MGLGVCWSPHYDTQGLVLLGCAEFGYGIMGFTTKEANGSPAKTENYGFGNVGPMLEVEYSLGKHVHIGAQAGADFILGNYSAHRQDGSRIFETRNWSVHGAFGVGVHF